MGIYSRDYIREDYGPRGGAWRDANVVKWLIIVNVAVFVLQVVWQVPVQTELPKGLPDELWEMAHYDEPTVNRWFALDRSAIFGGQVWRLLTYEFLHDHHSPWHLVFNMWFLYLAGRKVEDYYGSREFLWFYLAAGCLSGVFSVFWFEAFGHPGWSAIGASGAVAGVFIVYALYWPFDIIRIFGVIPVQAMWLAILNVVVDVFPMLQQIGGRHYGDGIAHSAHFGGMLFAFLYQRRNWRVADWIPALQMAGWKRKLRLRRTKLRVYAPESRPEDDADFEQRVDAALQKVQEHGEASLTDAERALLMEASRRYRNKVR